MKNDQNIICRAKRSLLFTLFLLSMTASTIAQTSPFETQAVVQNDRDTKAVKPATPLENRDIDLLKAQLAAQQDELNALRKTVEEQGRLIASVLKVNAGAAMPAKADASRAAGPPAKAEALAADPVPMAKPAIGQDDASPLSFRIGKAYFTPFGFVDLTAVVRSRNVGSGIGTNFGAVPLSNTVNGNLYENRFSAANSRLGLRVDAKVRDIDVLGYLETDFSGTSPGNIAVTSHSNTSRLRLFWVDLRKKKFELLAGQSWSLFTPNRKGLSPLPADVFFGQAVDANYPVGLTWSRSPQFRLVYHATDTITLAWSLEASEQYGGGSGGSGSITLPSGLASSYASQLNTGDSTFGVPNPHQDNIFKIAFDPTIGGRAAHLEVAGLLRRFRFYNPASDRNFAASGGGVSVNGNIELFKDFRLIANTFYSNGGGRWIFGQGPDLIIKGDGSPSLVRAYSTVDGFEYQATPKALFYGYYSGAYFQKNVAIDPANGLQTGFGYTGSPDNHNRSIQEGTLGLTYTFWRDPNYGAMQFMAQYSYLARRSWYVAPGQPGTANLNMVFLNLRYTLPGAPPK